MTPASWISLAIGLGSLTLNMLAMAIGYGVLKGTVTAIEGRVRAIEAEIGAITELKVAVGKIEVKQDAMFEHIRDLAASVRWMREPAHAATTTRRKPPA